MSLSDLCALLGLAPSTTHRLLTTLEAERFVRFERGAGLWQVGVQAFVVGQAFARQRDLPSLARPALRRLVEETGETANLYLLVDDEAVCMAQVESRQTVRAIARPGGRAPLHASGVGKAILAALASEEVDRLIRCRGLPRLTERTLDTPSRLRAELARVRARGHAVDDEENAPGLRCVAAALVDETGAPIGALSISGPSARLGDERLAELARRVEAAAADTVRALGGRLPERPGSAG